MLSDELCESALTALVVAASGEAVAGALADDISLRRLAVGSSLEDPACTGAGDTLVMRSSSRSLRLADDDEMAGAVAEVASLISRAALASLSFGALSRFLEDSLLLVTVATGVALEAAVVLLWRPLASANFTGCVEAVAITNT